mgnify:FL=1
MRIMLSTIDNPYDPFDDFKNWFLFDVQHGYNSCAYLARIARTSDQFTEKEMNEEIEKAIDEIIELDFMNVYVKVKK